MGWGLSRLLNSWSLAFVFLLISIGSVHRSFAEDSHIGTMARQLFRPTCAQDLNDLAIRNSLPTHLEADGVYRAWILVRFFDLPGLTQKVGETLVPSTAETELGNYLHFCANPATGVPVTISDQIKISDQQSSRKNQQRYLLKIESADPENFFRALSHHQVIGRGKSKEEVASTFRIHSAIPDEL